ncbi:DUF2946 family protein [Glaciimonas sp. PAMC28666]|uniref:DUF2946 family protein n=1 Tax=Glaciimonas sp. PAMC28666 TaxID=2807626 RepID=UPI0019643AE8|nr:DUF2946 domain-containing protein [Glaciimonas sp. PAMC28666]QRX83615.1 DUF2946 domain-containing protein [Glaciimonas sp. PAMC28666]
MQFGAWMGILIILLSGFAPLISQTLAATRSGSNHKVPIRNISQETPLGVTHSAQNPSTHDAMTVAAVSAATGSSIEHHAVYKNTKIPGLQCAHDEQTSHHGHRGQDACGYCNLLAHSPFVISTLPLPAVMSEVHHTFIAALRVAFRPHTVAAASRPQPPPLS